jgi:hypothetical protein
MDDSDSNDRKRVKKEFVEEEGPVAEWKPNQIILLDDEGVGNNSSGSSTPLAEKIRRAQSGPRHSKIPATRSDRAESSPKVVLLSSSTMGKAMPPRHPPPFSASQDTAIQTADEGDDVEEGADDIGEVPVRRR